MPEPPRAEDSRPRSGLLIGMIAVIVALAALIIAVGVGLTLSSGTDNPPRTPPTTAPATAFLPGLGMGESGNHPADETTGPNIP